jgi:putative ABC transport system permease protein
VVIDENTARKLFGVAELAIGKMVRLTNGVNFQVVGVTEAEYEDSRPSIFIPLATANVIYNPSGWVYDVSYELEGVETAEEAKAYSERLRGQLAQYYGYDPADQNAIWIANRIESYEQSKMIFNGISLFIWVIGIGTLIAGIVGVSNIMLITVKERTREFGIRKALGATPNSILGLVVLESLVITLIFGYIGMMMGVGLSELLCMFFPEGGGSSMQLTFLSNPTVDLGIVFSATMVLVVAGVLAGYMPARNAVKIKPIEAMNAK